MNLLSFSYPAQLSDHRNTDQVGLVREAPSQGLIRSSFQAHSFLSCMSNTSRNFSIQPWVAPFNRLAEMSFVLIFIYF
jgi:hypothetical protein